MLTEPLPTRLDVRKAAARGVEIRGVLKPSDLARVPGIGPHGVQMLTPHLAFGFAPSARGSDPDLPQVDPSTSLLDVNRAQIKELEQITGVGPVLASRIVASRQRLGPFRRPEDLLRVPGIGPAVLQRIRARVRF